MSEEEIPYYADEFFIQDNDPGVAHVITARGRELVVVMHSTLSLPDLKYAQQAAIKVKKNLKSGVVTVQSVDEDKFIYHILCKLIKSWPFTDRATGKQVPVTLATLAHLDGMILAQLSKIANEYLAGKQLEVDFSESPLDAAS